MNRRQRVPLTFASNHIECSHHHLLFHSSPLCLAPLASYPFSLSVSLFPPNLSPLHHSPSNSLLPLFYYISQHPAKLTPTLSFTHHHTVSGLCCCVGGSVKISSLDDCDELDELILSSSLLCPFTMLNLHSGHVGFVLNHLSMHEQWKWWRQGSSRSSAPSSYTLKQMQHSCKGMGGANNKRVFNLCALPDFGVRQRELKFA